MSHAPSSQAIPWARDQLAAHDKQEMGTAARLALMLLADHARPDLVNPGGDDGTPNEFCYPSKELLAHDMGLSAGRVRAALRQLERLRLIRRHEVRWLDSNKFAVHLIRLAVGGPLDGPASRVQMPPGSVYTKRAYVAG